VDEFDAELQDSLFNPTGLIFADCMHRVATSILPRAPSGERKPKPAIVRSDRISFARVGITTSWIDVLLALWMVAVGLMTLMMAKGLLGPVKNFIYGQTLMNSYLGPTDRNQFHRSADFGANGKPREIVKPDGNCDGLSLELYDLPARAAAPHRRLSAEAYCGMQD
jgi:hypothetical protein